MKKGILAACLGLLACGAVSFAQDSKSVLKDVRVEQKLGNQVPLDVPFKDEFGKDVKLKDYFGKRPVMLMMVFYKCAGVCAFEFDGMIKALRDLKEMNPGKEFEVVTVGINPTETPKMAEDKAKEVFSEYRRDVARPGWHFLTGKLKDIKAVTEAAGFFFTYDEVNGLIRHPAAVAMLTPDGTVSKYFLGYDYAASGIKEAILSAKDGRVGEKAIEVGGVKCVEPDPKTKQYKSLAMQAMQVMGIGTVLVLATSIFLMERKRKKGAS